MLVYYHEHSDNVELNQKVKDHLTQKTIVWIALPDWCIEVAERCDAILVSDEDIGCPPELDGIPFYVYPDVPSKTRAELQSPHQSQEFLRLVMHMYRVHLKKNSDYSPANILGTGMLGLATRIWDKVARMLNLTGFELEVNFIGYSNPKYPAVTGENLDDTLMDMAVYALIAIIYRAGKWGR